jgi:hypothetical protein
MFSKVLSVVLEKVGGRSGVFVVKLWWHAWQTMDM